MRELLDARKVVNLIGRLDNFKWIGFDRKPYGHIGATFCDAGLQAGLNYKTVVAPRIQKLLKKWPSAKTTTAFRRQMVKGDLRAVLDWYHPKKIQRIEALVNMAKENDIETEAQLGAWIEAGDNDSKLLGIDGIGSKTVDYLRMLTGRPAIAIDRHIRAFSVLAGSQDEPYSYVSRVMRFAGDLLDVDYRVLDLSIWQFMSQRAS